LSAVPGIELFDEYPCLAQILTLIPERIEHKKRVREIKRRQIEKASPAKMKERQPVYGTV
jgi:hypothetical protein